MSQTALHLDVVVRLEPAHLVTAAVAAADGTQLYTVTRPEDAVVRSGSHGRSTRRHTAQEIAAGD